ncbi:Exocyst complex component 2, partial [Orchesella cincta]
WVSPNKILARTLLCKTKGDIVIITRSGGIGTSTVQFRGYLEASVGPTKESPVWVDETVSVGPRPLSMTAYQQEDPLQISVEGNDKKFPVEELLELFPEGSGNLRSENFVPAWFLLENHHATSFDDLKLGLNFLGRKVGSQTEGKLSFLKENISSVIDQLDALIALKEKCDKYKTMHGSSFVAQIDDAIGVSEREAGKLFQGVLAKKDRADMTRNALSGYQRFKFLFSLPGTMEKSIQKEEFDQAINDYSRAKALFEQPETDKPIFRKFQKEVETRAYKLRETLRNKLVERPPKIEEQRAILDYLMTLQCDYDPAWVCLVCHFEFLTNSMKNCFQQFSTMDSNNANSARTPSKQDHQNALPNQVLFVENLSELFSTYFPDFWHLGQDYFGGKLPVKPNLSKQAEMKKMMINTVQLFGTLVTSCLLPSGSANTDEFEWQDKASESMSEWLQHCLGFIKDTYTDFLSLDPPKEMIEILRNLLFQIRCYSLEIMLHQLSTEVADLYKQETWSSEPMGDHGFVTPLPAKFETVIINACKVIKETLLQKYNEERPLLNSEEVKNRMREGMGNALSAFADSLELLISQNRGSSQLHSSQKSSMTLPLKDGGLRSGLPTSQTASLLLILNNCSYTKVVILPQIYKALVKLGYPDMSESVEKARVAINGVENLTFAKYTEMKYEPVVGQIEQSMYAGRFDWEKCGEPVGVRPYITKTILGMIEVIAEVTAVSEKLVTTVMTQVIESVCEELTRLFSCIAKFSENGAMQATLDMAAFQDAVSGFLTGNSINLVNETFSLIPRSKEMLRSSRRIQHLLDDHRSKTKMQYQCLISSNTTKL